MKYFLTILSIIILVAQGHGKDIINEEDNSNTFYKSDFDVQLSSSSFSIPSIPKFFQVKQNYPNPFNSSTTIEYNLSQHSSMILTIYNSIGKKVRTLVNGLKEPGRYKIEWDGKNNSGSVVSSGVYFYTILADEDYSIKKMILLK